MCTAPRWLFSKGTPIARSSTGVPENDPAARARPNASPDSGRANFGGRGAAPCLRSLTTQRRVLEAVQAGDIGTTARQVAETTGVKSTNTPRMLKHWPSEG